MKVEQRTRAQVITLIVAAARRPCPPVVNSLHGGYAFQAANGTTFGVRRDTQEECRDAWKRSQDAQGAEFRAQLEGMSDAKLSDQRRYWLKEAS